jgi:alanyl-tRNA synthetase
MKQTAQQLRQAFIDYFERHAHQPVPSSPLIPQADPTLLFTNAGMNQFKGVFLGEDSRPYKRAVTVQKCMRAGGKHNDLENVGYTGRHHTFFEMLGNFSFGDYFKKEAIRFGWEFLTETVGLPNDKLWVTIFRDDDEAARIWEHEIGVSPSRIMRCNEKDNFWQMGETGPCGPCSEIHYDQGPGVPGDDIPNGAGDRVMEIWNLVFMQYNRDSKGTLTPLPKPSIDTGMGLERLAAVVQGVTSNYDTDLFTPILAAIATRTGHRYRQQASADRSMRRVEGCRRDDRRRDAGRGGAFHCDSGSRAADFERSRVQSEGWKADDLGGRGGLQTLRHLRLSHRSDYRSGARAWSGAGRGGLSARA